MRQDLLAGIARNAFLVIGRVGLDLFPDPGIGIETMQGLNVDMGGSSANIAAGIVKLGGRAALMTAVSDDAVGRACRRLLRAYGVDDTLVRTVGGEARTSLAIYETRLEDHQSVIYRNGAADFQMSGADVRGVDYARFGALVTAGTVLAAEPSRSATFEAFDLARAAGLPIIFDVDYRPYSWPSAEVAEDVLSRAAALSDVIVGNDEEFGFMAGGIDRGAARARDLAARGAGVVVYKMGAGGAITWTDGAELRTGIYPVETLKPTGAGDSFMAGMLTGIAAGLPLREAVLRGSACAAIVVGKPGCAPAMPDSAELEDFLKRHPGPTRPDER